LTAEHNFEASYFPGCTMKTGADESNRPMAIVLKKLKVKLNEIDDWNCCGSSSGHAINHQIPLGMGARNFTRIPEGVPVVIPCPNCYRNWAIAQHHLLTEPELRRDYEREFGRIYAETQLLNIYDVYLQVIRDSKAPGGTPLEGTKPLKGLKVAVYNGCGAMYPKEIRPKFPRDSVNNVVKELGAESVVWPWPNKCCSAFVSAVYAEIAEDLATQIISGAIDAGADALVTACAMCQMNLEMRMDSAKLINKIPVFHLNQLVALYLGEKPSEHKDWWKYHLVDPTPVLERAGLWE
jgi:heterodisulfide reductase subunit B